MDNHTLDKTSLTTIALLEARLKRIEQLLYGTVSPPTSQPPTSTSVVSSLNELERHFALLITRARVYADILKLYSTHPTFFQAANPATPPSQLDLPALRATVLSQAAAFPSTVSALTTIISDTPLPNPSVSADLVTQLPRMKALEVVQLAQEAEVAELRARGEAVVRAWYRERVLRYGTALADVEGRIEGVEKAARRQEKVREAKAVGIGV